MATKVRYLVDTNIWLGTYTCLYGFHNQCPSWVDTPDDPPNGTTEDVRIIHMLFNPLGDEDTNEATTIKNFSSQTMSLIRWEQRNDNGTSLSLDVLVDMEPNEEKTLQ